MGQQDAPHVGEVWSGGPCQKTLTCVGGCVCGYFVVSHATFSHSEADLG